MPKFDLSSFNNRNFWLRLASALVLAPLVIWIVAHDGYPFMYATCLMVSGGLSEWALLIDRFKKRQLFWLDVALAMAILFGALLSTTVLAWSGLMLALSFILVLSRFYIRSLSTTLWGILGFVYMAAFGWSLLYLRHFHDLVMGMDLVFYLLAVVWGTDIGAYIIGRVMGGPKLAPQISPGKTWAGVWGGLGVAGLAAVGFCLYEGVPLATKPLFLAFGLSGASQIGDLFESYVKRRAGVKESGGLIPGHGGILDRIDGLVFASILLMLFQMAGGNLISW